MVNVLSFDVLTTSLYGLTLFSKMLIFLVAIFIGVGITATGVKLSKAETPQRAMELFGRISLLAKTNIVLGSVIILLAVLLRYGL